MNDKVLSIIFILASTTAIVFYQYTLGIELQKTNDYLNQIHSSSIVFIEIPETRFLENKVSQLKRIEVEPNISDSKKTEILSLLADLHSAKKATLEKAKAQLVKRANLNLDERNFIIFHLLDNVDYEDFSLIYDNPEKRNIWTVSIDILADLEAEEGIRYFVNGLDSMPLVKRTFYNIHAYNAVLKLKEKSVPSLILALRFGRPEIRMGSAEVLAEIDSEMSRNALESALITEQDDWVKSVIKQNLGYLKRKCEEHNYFQECSNHSWNF